MEEENILLTNNISIYFPRYSDKHIFIYFYLISYMQYNEYGRQVIACSERK